MFNMVTQERLKELFDYREDGVLIAKDKSREHGAFLMRMRSNGKSRYKMILVDKKRLLLHRAIFAYHNGFYPSFLDHINRNKYDNRIENLREAAQKQNRVNSVNQKHKQTKYKGVCLCNRPKKYKVEIRLNKKKSLYLGNFYDEDTAAKAYNCVSRILHGELAFQNTINSTQ